MAFDAGSAVGKLGLDLSEYTKGMLTATSLAETFPNIVTSFLANPLLGLVEVAKQVAEAVVEAAKAMVENFRAVAEAADEASDSAEKLGVSVQFLSTIRPLAKAAGVGGDAFGDAIKMLEKSTQEAIEDPDKSGAAKSFKQLGISMEEVQKGAENPEQFFMRTADAIGAMGNNVQKTAAAMQLMGRGGADLIPIFNQGSESLKEWMNLIDSVGGGFDQRTADMAQKVDELGIIWDAVWGRRLRDGEIRHDPL